MRKFLLYSEHYSTVCFFMKTKRSYFAHGALVGGGILLGATLPCGGLNKVVGTGLGP